MFISFEGVDSSGKSTQIKKLYDYFVQNGVACVLTKEPGGWDSANKIRSLLLENNDFLPITQLLLINASRSENISKVITPALQSGKVVLCDRFIDSTIVYQAKKSGLGLDIVKKLHDILFCVNGKQVVPDVTFYLQITKSTAIKRIQSKKTSLFSHGEHNWLDEGVEKETSSMIKWFDELTKNDPFQTQNISKRIITIDANPLPEVIFENILLHCRNLKLI